MATALVVAVAGVASYWITRRNVAMQARNDEATYLLSQYRKQCGRLEHDEIPSNHALPAKLERAIRRRDERRRGQP